MKPGSRLAARRAAKAAAAAAADDAPPGAPPAVAVTVAFPPQLSAAQRALVHELAGAAGLAHRSAGEGDERRILVGDAADVLSVEHDGGAVADATLARWLSQYCSLQVPVAAAAPSRAPAAPQLTVDAFCTRTLSLLELERASEVEQSEAAHAASEGEEAVRRGVCLAGLRVTDASPGLLGRSILTLSPARGEGAPLPAHKFTPHDVVALRPSRGDSLLAQAVVCRVTESTIAIALDEAPDESLDGTLRLERLANEVTYTRLKHALKSLAAAGAGGVALVDVLFGTRAPCDPPLVLPRFVALNSGLDDSQVAAVRFALAAPEVALIHGPPGTGKTTALVELVAQLVARGERVLCCAASNVAVDNLLERLRAADPKLRAVRLGHPARLSPAVLECCLDAVVARADSSALAADVRTEMKQLSARLLKLRPHERAERRDTRRQLGALAKEERARTSAAIAEVLARAQVVAATLTGALSRTLDAASRAAPFDVVVIDEAAQALEVACWGALLKGRRAVLAGDHHQLPPTVLSDAAARSGLSRTLFERVHALHPGLSRMLTVQYRMHGSIADWASGELYGNSLTAPAHVASRTLVGLPGVAAAAELPVLLLIDTAGCDMEESGGGSGAAESKANEGEARAALAHAARLVAAGVPASCVGIITPYAAQVALLRELRAESGAALAALEVSTVDGFQGREKEAIVISCVRSNAAHEVGFLADARRMNVAVTRARRHVALLGDTETLSRGDPFLARLCVWFEAHGEVRGSRPLCRMVWCGPGLCGWVVALTLHVAFQVRSAAEYTA